jgi:putative hydrolase of the HAD superfamily
MKRQTLLVDGDGTLWEPTPAPATLLEELIEQLTPLGFSPAYLRHVLNERQRRSGHAYGYSGRFGAWLEEAYRSLAGERVRADVLAWLQARAAELERQPPRLLEGVAATLAALTRRHRLILFARGEPAQQAALIESSGLERYFEAVEVAEPDRPRDFADLVARYRVVKSSAWMVGDSAADDIEPALAAGLNAVFVPPAGARVTLSTGAGRLVLASSFSQLVQVF